MPEDWEKQKEWFESIKLKIMKGEIESPEWLTENSSDYDDFPYPTSLHLEPKDENYKMFGEKIKKLINSVEAEKGPQ